MIPFEIDDSVFLFVTTPTKPRAGNPLVITASGFLLRKQKAFLGLSFPVSNLSKVADTALSTAGSNRFVLSNCHLSPQYQHNQLKNNI
jgi:hypothetical protein